MLKKRYLLFGLAIAALVAVAAFGSLDTLAWFGDTAGVDNNEFVAGVVDLNVGGATTMPFSVSNMAPGDSATEYLVIRNDGNLDLIFRMYIDDVWESESGFRHYFEITDITINPTAGPQVYNSGPVNGTIVGSAMPLNGLVGVGNALTSEDAAFDGYPLEPGEIEVYGITVKLKTSAPNQYQGETLNVDLRIDATQFDNQTEGSVVY